MTRPSRPPTLGRLLAGRVVLAATAVTLLLSALTLVKYLLDTPKLRAESVAAEVKQVVAALRQGVDPAARPYYRDFPADYGLRIFDRRRLPTRRMVASVNAELFAPLSGPNGEAGSVLPEMLSEGLRVFPASGTERRDRWIMTDHEDIAGQSYWVQVVIVDDPAWLWLGVMREEMIDHVVLPVVTYVPALILAMLVTIRGALRPLKRVAQEAAQLGAAVGTGRPLVPLSAAALSAELHELVAAINAMIRRLERALRLQRQFTADVAHELRTPLAVLMLELGTLPPSPAVAALREELLGMSAVVDQLLALAAAEEAAEAAREPADLTAAARKVCEDLALAALARGQLIEFDAEGPVPVSGHPVLIETALRNVIDNALKYAPGGTVVSVRVDAAARVAVADRGPGIPDAQKELIFSRFWRADRRGVPGAGVGLALVRRIVQLHKGEVWVEDRAGGGACFILAFPACGTG